MPLFHHGSDSLIITKIFHNVPEAPDTACLYIILTFPDVFIFIIGKILIIVRCIGQPIN